MKPVVTTLIIDRPLEEVFDVATCQRRCVTWHTGITGSKKLTDGPVGVGTEYEQQSRLLGFTALSHVRITRWEPPYHFAAHGEGNAATYELEMNFEQLDGGTKVTCTMLHSGAKAMLARFSEPLLHMMLERMNEKDFQTLKTLMEAEAPILAEQVHIA